ncbi:hypothetical protein ACV3X3_15265 [Clostridium perfringens]
MSKYGQEKLDMKNEEHSLYFKDLIKRGYKMIYPSFDYIEMFKVSDYIVGYYGINHVNKTVWIGHEPGKPEEKYNLEDIKVTLEVDFREIKVK